MLRVAICDPDRKNCNFLYHTFLKYCNDCILYIEVFHSGKALYDAIQFGKRYELYVLEVELPVIDGIQIGIILRNELQETIFVSMHLTEIIDMEPPPPANFIQIHKSFIVNYKFVKHLAYDKVTLKDGAILPISNTFRKHMRQQISALPVALRK